MSWRPQTGGLYPSPTAVRQAPLIIILFRNFAYKKIQRQQQQTQRIFASSSFLWK